MFFHEIRGRIFQETDSNVFVNDIIKSIKSKLLAKSSSYVNWPDWLRYKNATINLKKLMIDILSMLLSTHNT